MTTRYIYVSGPMRKIPEFNFPAFAAAKAVIERLDPEAVVFSPAQKDLDAGFDTTGRTGHEDLKYELGFDLRAALAMDCEWICSTATEIYMLRGWSRSSGARAELALAQALGLTVGYQPGAQSETLPSYDEGWNAAMTQVNMPEASHG